MKAVTLGLALTLGLGCGKNDKPAASSTEATKPEPTKAKVSTGDKLWEFETGSYGYVYSSPAIGSDGTVYVGSLNYKIYAIKTDSKGLANSPWPMFRQNARHTGRVMKE